jgi:hypothetical protein
MNECVFYKHVPKLLQLYWMKVHFCPSTPSTKIINYYIDEKTLTYVKKKTSAYDPTNGSKFV